MSQVETSPPRPSMKERQWQLRQEAILDAAVDFLQTKGFDSMTLDDITESIGISRPTLYQHFFSKEDMVVHVALRNLLRGVEKLRELDNDRPALDRLLEFLDWAMQNRFGSCRSVFTDLGNLIIVAKLKNEQYRTAGAEFKERFANMIGQAQVEGEVRKDIRPELLGETVMSIYKSPGFDELVQKGAANVAEVRDCIVKLLQAR
jgi:AcrR family transcriptional regulator